MYEHVAESHVMCYTVLQIVALAKNLVEMHRFKIIGGEFRNIVRVSLHGILNKFGRARV